MRALLVAAALLPVCATTVLAPCPGQQVVTRNERADGYRGIWYYNQKSNDEYVYKYSGGLGTYCAKHQPFAVHRPEVDKTFFCYGGTTAGEHTRLLHMVSVFDHATGTVPRPTILLDKQTGDAHDNPVLSVDGEGHVWVFSTSHGRARPSFIHKSVRPYDVGEFERVDATFVADDGSRRPFDNFSYLQAFHDPDDGFACFFTRYGDPAARTSMFVTSDDGVRWSQRRRLAAIEKGHYQIGTVAGGKAAVACNYHPDPKGLNWRTNLYYLESSDGGASWRDAHGRALQVPLTAADNGALVHDYRSEGLLVYLKDVRLDEHGRPAILFLTSKGYRSGPANDPRTWRVARFDGERWSIHDVTTSDHNYDMGSLYLEGDGRMRILAPTLPGPQRSNPGGEVAMWTSDDDGRSWRMARQLTANSRHNHTYVRRPVDAHPDFYALWADGDARRPSASRLHFATRDGRVFRLPRHMHGDTAHPIEVVPAPAELPAVEPFVLSEHGCGRATAYSNANKIVTIGHRTHVAWLDSFDGAFHVRMRTLDNRSGTWSPTYTIGTAHDNHGGPALTADSDGYLHVVFHPHHHPLRYRRSLRANDASAWTDEVRFGARATYPSLVCGPDDTLYCAVRESDRRQPWQVRLYRKRPGEAWDEGVTLLRARLPEYAQFGQHLQWHGDRLHASFWAYEGIRQQRLTTTIGYLRSDDGGDSWQGAAGNTVTLPADTATFDRIASRDGVDEQLRGGALAIAPDGTPSIFYRMLDEWPGSVLRASPDRTGAWQSRAIELRADGDPARDGRSLMTTLCATFDRRGGLCLTALTQPDALPAAERVWGTPSLEAVFARADGSDAPFAVSALTTADATRPRWLVSLERPFASAHPQRPALLYTDGTREKDNGAIVHNRVVFVRR